MPFTKNILKFDNTKLHEKANGLVAFGLSFLAAMLGWLALMELWNWFVAPLGLSRLGYWQSAGLSLLISLVRSNSEDAAKLDEVTTWYKLHRRTFYSFLLPLIYLLVGWIAHFLTHKP
jgi:hypothetical protein